MGIVYTPDIADETAVPVPPRRKPVGARPYTAITLLVTAVAIWLVAIPLARDATAGQYGLLATTGGVYLLLSLVLDIAAFVVAVAKNNTLTAVLAIGIVTIIQRLTVTLITDVPIYSWTYKHIGIVNYIMSYHSPPRVGVHGEWPGFFAAMAWFSTVSGVDPVDAAHWFAPVAAALISLMGGALALVLGFNIRVALITAMLAQILNWTGQDYYSPQAIALIMAVAILALLSHSNKMPSSAYISVPIFAALVATHQLTPVWLCFLTIGLAVLREIRPRWLPLVYVAIFAIYLGPRLNATDRYGLFSGFNPVKNSEIVATGRGSDGREFTILVERLLSVSVWLAAAICCVLIWRRYGFPWMMATMAFSPILLLGGQSYGGEAIIRVFLYSIAGCAVLLAIVAAQAFSLTKPIQKVLACGTTMAFLIGVAAAGMQGYYGGWSYLTVTRTQLEYSRQLVASTGGRLVIGNLAPAAGWPDGLSVDFVNLELRDPGYGDMLESRRGSLLHKAFATSEDVETLESAIPDYGPPRPLYIVLPHQDIAYGEYFGWFPPTFVPSLIDRLSERPGWIMVDGDATTVIFKYAGGVGWFRRAY